MSKLETGHQLPSAGDITTWVAAADGPEGADVELTDLLTRARVEYATWRDAYRASGAAAVQRTAREREAAATRIAEFQPAMMPGLIQTAGYARELLHMPCGPKAWGATEADIEEMIAERIHRQEVLYQSDKQLHLLLGEAALHTRFGSLDTLVGQLDRLIALAGLAHVELAVIPFAAALPIFPLGGFKVHDADLVIVETLTGEQLLTEPDEVVLYTRFIDELRNAALVGTDAVALVRTVMGNLPAS